MLNVVLKQKGDYSLIAKINDKDEAVHEYVVCMFFDGSSWSSGHYTWDLDHAIEVFNQNTEDTEDSEVSDERR